MHNALVSPFTEGCFSKLTNMTIYPNALTRSGLQKLWGGCPNIIDLKILQYPRVGAATLHEEDFVPSPASRPPLDNTTSAAHNVDAWQLRSFCIDDVTSPNSMDTMFRRIDALALQDLDLNTFNGAGRLLQALAAHFAGRQPDLTRLRVFRPAADASRDLVAGMLLLLTSFCGLHELIVCCDNCEKLDADGIVNHG